MAYTTAAEQSPPAGRGEGVVNVSPACRKDCLTLVRLTGGSWGLCMVLPLFVAALDRWQRFDLTSRVQVVQVILRSSAFAIAPALGFGLIEMCLIFIAAQI